MITDTLDTGWQGTLEDCLSGSPSRAEGGRVYMSKGVLFLAPKTPLCLPRPPLTMTWATARVNLCLSPRGRSFVQIHCQERWWTENNEEAQAVAETLSAAPSPPGCYKRCRLLRSSAVLQWFWTSSAVVIATVTSLPGTYGWGAASDVIPGAVQRFCPSHPPPTTPCVSNAASGHLKAHLSTGGN